MGLGRLLTRPAATRPSDTRTITEFATIDGAPAFGENANVQTYRGGMSIPGAWRASLLIADLIGSVPWNAWRERGESIERVEPRPLLLDQPFPPHTRMSTFRSWALDLVWHGNAVGLVATRNRSGWPTSAIPVPATEVQVRYRYGPQGPTSEAALSGPIEYLINGRPVDTDDVIHVMGPAAPGALRGFGVLEAHMAGVLDLAREQMRQAGSISRHGVPTGKLKVSDPDASDEDMREVKEGWLRSQRERSVAVLNSTTDFEPLAWNPDELQLVEARKYTLHELALIFGLPLSFLGADQASRTYSNIEQEGLNLLKYSLAGHLAQFEQTLSLHLPRGTWAQANLDSILRSDTLSRYRAHQIGLTAGFLTVDEVRETEYLPPLPDDVTPTPDEQDDQEGESDDAAND